MMDRRAFLDTLASGLLAAPLGAQAQGPRKVPRVGIVASTSPATGRETVDAFRPGLSELGYVEGQTIVIEERWAGGRLERFDSLIADLVKANVDVIVDPRADDPPGGAAAGGSGD
jgi:putative ABC transport system substrate-binding protein